MQLPKWKICKETAGLLKQSTLNSSLQDISFSGCPIFTCVTLTHALINFIVADDQSINGIECREFRDLLLLLHSDLQDKDIPHCTKLREAIIKAWESHFKALWLGLTDTVGKVSFTADLWSDKNLHSYLCITTHWIACNKHSNQLELKTALIMFHNVTDKHDSANLATVILQLLDHASITALMGWFVDPMETFIVAECLREPGAQTFEEAVKCDPIALGRVVVCKI